MINEFHTKRMKGYVEENHGGNIIHGDIKTIDTVERFVPPIIVDNPKDDSKMMQDEIFGPILPMKEVENVD